MCIYMNNLIVFFNFFFVININCPIFKLEHLSANNRSDFFVYVTNLALKYSVINTYTRE